jgi:hypothetical protein
MQTTLIHLQYHLLVVEGNIKYRYFWIWYFFALKRFKFSNGFPKQVAAETILRTINNFFRNNSGSTTIKVVNFVLYDQESVSVYLSELAKIETNW